MSIEEKSLKLKEIVASYNTQWFLGELSDLRQAIGGGHAQDQLGSLSSPLRQLYFLGGLSVSSNGTNATKFSYDPGDWNRMVQLLNEIEDEYDKLFFPKKDEVIDKEWKHVRSVAIPSFLAYFNQGPLNYEEQSIEWTEGLFQQLDDIIERFTGLKTEDFVEFYNILDSLVQKNFQSITKGAPLRADWKTYVCVECLPNLPSHLSELLPESKQAMFTYRSDPGMINRFFPFELVSGKLPEHRILAILHLLSCKKSASDFMYYTATRPGNPLLENPILCLENGMYQVFEVKQVIHAIQNMLQELCCSSDVNRGRYTLKKGKLLEEKVIQLLTDFLGDDIKVFKKYYVDGHEKDILILWKGYAFIVEPKGYKLREPFRDPNTAFTMLKKDFDSSIGYGYGQAVVVQQKFIDKVPLKIQDKNGKVLEEIDTLKFEDSFCIVVNTESFKQIQHDLSTLLKIGEDDIFPWVVKLDDLEVFLLTMKAKGKTPLDLVNYLLLREELHGRLICADELEVCGAYLSGKFTEKDLEGEEVFVATPDLASIFDDQYQKGLGFKNEKLLAEKKSEKYIFY